MITSHEIMSIMERECRICMRLFSKLPSGSFDYRPTAGQRSTFELLQFMSYAIAGAAHAIAGNGWDWWKEHEAIAEKMSPRDFPGAMERQIDELSHILETMTEDTFNNEKVAEMPWPTDNTIGVELLDNCLRWLIGYRMQLFLYARSNGVEISTRDCWFLTEDDPTATQN
ncbi:MAG TPA: hypothetical protein EYQ20_12745 [candidate division Zixibacteria bacterium]|nr:hypothetical protein [candidate division Zixibacteria bacterium]